MQETTEDTIAVIGDIHGCINTLSRLYDTINKYTKLVFSVGDVIDRGPSSREVVQFCIDKGLNCVRGNHEDMLIKAVESPSRQNLYIYYLNGGQSASYSYIESFSVSDFGRYKSELIKFGHYEFMKKMPLKYEFDGLIISHAGIIEGGDDESILWNRSAPARLEKFQIFGHTPVFKPDYHKGYYVNIDTGCVRGNKLTAVLADRKKGDVIDIISEKCKDVI